MKNLRRPVGQNDERAKPLRFNRERLSAYPQTKRGAALLRLPVRVLRYLLYVVLLFVRIPVQIVSRLAVAPLLLFAVVWGFLKGWTSTPALMMAGASFALFALSFLYDTVLLLVAPESIYLDT